MKIFEMIVNIVFFIFSIYVELRYIKLFLRPKEHCSIGTKCICAVGIAVNWAFYFFLPSQVLITLSAFSYVLLLTIFNYKGSILEKVLAVGLTMALGVVAEGIIWRFQGWINDGNINEPLGSLMSNLLLLIIVVTLERYMKFDKEIRLSWGSYFNMIIVSLCGVILAEIITDISVLSYQVVMMGLCAICIMNIGTYYMYEKVYDAYKEKMTKIVLEKQITMYQNQFEIIHASRQDMKQLRHDMKNHILLLESYLQKEKYTEAQKYIEQLAEKVVSKKEYVNTGNDELDSILNYQLRKAYNLHCETDVKIEVPKERFMSDFDLNMLLSNLLDNALEAIENVEKRVLTIRIKYIKRILYISVYNSYNGIVKKKGDKLFTTKMKKEEHGIGMTCIQSVVDKYHGEMTIQMPKDMFQVDIILYV